MPATGVTLSGSLSGIVKDIRTRAYKYMMHDGVCKALVTPVGVGQKGNKVTEPYWDPTARAGTAATEGTDFTGFTSYVSSTREYTAAEWIHGTLLTYNDYEDASESVRDEHGRMHGLVHGKKLEQKICSTFASFGNSITATATGGLTIAKIAAAKTLVVGETQAFTGPYNLVLTPNVHYRFWNGLTNVSNVGVLGSLGDRLLDNYYQGTVLGDVRCFITQTGITTATTVNCGLFVKPAVALFMPRDFDLRTEENISLRAYELVSTHRAGARVRLANGGCKIATLGSDPS